MQKPHKFLINIVCSVSSGKYLPSVFPAQNCMKIPHKSLRKPQAYTLLYRPHTSLITIYIYIYIYILYVQSGDVRFAVLQLISAAIFIYFIYYIMYYILFYIILYITYFIYYILYILYLHILYIFIYYIFYIVYISYIFLLFSIFIY